MNSHIAKRFAEELGLEHHYGTFMALLDFMANVSSFTPTTQTGLNDTKSKENREASFQRPDGIGVSQCRFHSGQVGGSNL